jgi:uncharacterized membrane protein YcaP (DUF421 family)
MAAVLRAIFGYLFLVLMVRVVGRRPGKQITPFEFILIFFLGGLTLTGMVGDEVSLTNAFCQIIAVACCHYAIVWLRTKSSRMARIFDGTPLRLIDGGQYRVRTMEQMRVQKADLMAMARDQGIKSITDIDVAVLERNGEISLIKKED